MDKNSILEFNNKESASSRNHFFSSLKPYHKVEMSDMCVCFNYQNSKIIYQHFYQHWFSLCESFFTFYAICPTAIPAKHV